MTLQSMSQVGPYEIITLLGEGGMGQVYRARDPRLGREVAIKVLLPAFASDEGRLRRFTQEARAVALLNHPNLLQVYDTGIHGGTPYLVMELLEGRSLRERMEGRPLPMRKVLDYATQIARGLAVAHEKGIIHRDLKPENIFVEPDGRVKILDFGLAKLLTPVSGDTEATQDHLALSMLTHVGAVVGTAGYMSPEQVNGLPLDGRSDLFSFGIILWEMGCGQRPFQGHSVIETMHAILKDDPEETPGPNPFPPSLDRILRRCLEKDPKARFQSAQDLVFNLESASLPDGSSLSGAFLRTQRRSLARWWKPVAASLGFAALLGTAWWAGRQTGGPEPVTFHRLTYRNGLVRGARFAPDGQTYVYGMAQNNKPAELLVGRIDSLGGRALSLPPHTEILAISQAGEMALLLKSGTGRLGTLARAPLSGGAPREVMERVSGADWSPDGRDLAVIRNDENGNFILEYPLGHRLAESVGSTLMERPRVSPKGDQVSFLEYKGIGKAALVVVDLQGRRQVLVKGECGSQQWSPDGKRIFFTYRHADDRQDVRSVTLSGRQRILDTVMGRVRIHDVSRSGRLLLEHTVYKVSMFLKTPQDPFPRDLSWLQSSVAADIAADGGQVLFGEMREGAGPGGAYLRRADGADAVRLGDGDPVALSQDGKWALVSPFETAKELMVLPTGAGAPHRIKGIRSDWGLFLPGGQQLLVSGVGPAGTYQVFVVDLPSGEAKPWPGQANPDAYCVLAPDGARVALGPIDGKLEIRALDGRLLNTVPGLKDGEWLSQWSADGSSVYVVDPAHLPAKVFLMNLATGARTLWLELAPPEPTGVERIRNFAVTPDGRSYVFSFVRTLTSDLYLSDPLP